MALAGGGQLAPSPRVLDSESFRHYVDSFNSAGKEEVANYIADAEAWPWMKRNIPLFTCPDREVEEIYYFRWWSYRKHIKKTPAGFIVTEFLKPVNHASEYNAISCAFGHHAAEGRWLHDPQFIDQYANFWLRGGENGGLQKHFHQYSGWAAAALYDRFLVQGDRDWLAGQLDPLVLDYVTWERERLLDSVLFWQRDVSDGMEESVSGGRRVRNIRPSINSYMYGNARAIAAIAALGGNEKVAATYRHKAARLKHLVQTRLWNPERAFFETVLESGAFAGVRENIGFTPWYFDLPDRDSGFEAAWKQLMDAEGFFAPFGPTTAERRSPGFKIAYDGDDCQWNGPSWPFATTVTLKALSNVLAGSRQTAIKPRDYFKTFLIYTRSHRLKLDDGRSIPWIDENLHPLTGQWLARAKKLQKGTFYGRGDYYNHSSYADLVISGVVGLRPRADDVVEVSPLVPAGTWDWFCLDNVLYHGRLLAVLWDRTGTRFGRGRGLRLFSGGRLIARSPQLSRLTGRISP